MKERERERVPGTSYSFDEENFSSVTAIVINSKLECGPMSNVMVALPNIGGALCSTPQSLARAHCSTAVQ